MRELGRYDFIADGPLARVRYQYRVRCGDQVRNQVEQRAWLQTRHQVRDPVRNQVRSLAAGEEWMLIGGERSW